VTSLIQADERIDVVDHWRDANSWFVLPATITGAAKTFDSKTSVLLRHDLNRSLARG